MVDIELMPSLTDEQRSLVLRYLGEAERFTPDEWVTLLEAFTALGNAQVRIEGETLTFQAFYDRFVDQPYSDSLIADLSNEADIAARAPAIQAGYARQIYRRFREEPFALGHALESRCLLAYCLYWWASFARGYAFELEILRDLEEAGVSFVAHDLQVREQRLSPHDLALLGMRGDIKNTTYFLYVARSFPLSSDFYITRLYDRADRSYRRIVILTQEAWHRLDGPTVGSDLERAASLLPQVVGIQFLGYDLVVADYQMWKEKVLQRQQEGGERP